MAQPGEEAWTEHTSPLDRVRSVARGVSESRSAEYIAEEAAVSVETARKHLDSLVGLAVVLEHSEGDQPVYSPDPLHTRFQTIRTLLDTHDRDELIEIRQELQAQIDAWRDEYGVDAPDKLRQRIGEHEPPSNTENGRQIANEWDIVEYRLNIVTDAIDSSGSVETRND